MNDQVTKQRRKKMKLKYAAIVFIGLLTVVLIGCGSKDTGTDVEPVEKKVEGDIISLQSHNYPDHFIQHKDLKGELTPVETDIDKKDAMFRIVPGLVDSSLISFEAVSMPGYYLRHENFRIHLHEKSDDQLFKEDATFKKVPGLADNTWSSFESYNYPEYYIRHRDFHLYLEKGSDDLFKEDVTFKVIVQE
jgi:hypothetical protein